MQLVPCQLLHLLQIKFILLQQLLVLLTCLLQHLQLQQLKLSLEHNINKGMFLLSPQLVLQELLPQLLLQFWFKLVQATAQYLLQLLPLQPL